MSQLPADFVTDGFGPIGGRRRRLDRVRSCPQCVRAHMRDAGGLPRGSRGGLRGGGADITSGGMRDETTPGLGDAKLTTGEGP